MMDQQEKEYDEIGSDMNKPLILWAGHCLRHLLVEFSKLVCGQLGESVPSLPLVSCPMITEANFQGKETRSGIRVSGYGWHLSEKLYKSVNFQTLTNIGPEG